MNAVSLAVLRAIKQLTEEQHGQPPSLREIAKGYLCRPCVKRLR